jgi:hypothetical protein
MKSIRVSRVMVLVVCGLALMVAAGFVYVPTHSPHPDMRQYAKLMTAARHFRADLERQHQAVPESVNLRELLSRGFLTAADAKEFEGLQVTVSLRGDVERPNEALMRVQFPNGDECVALGDGSVQQFRR